MAAPDVNKAFLATGRLAYGCSNLASAFPHGGTPLGLVSSIDVIPQREWEALPQEETNSASTVVWLGGDVVVFLTMAAWDNDAIAFFCPNTSASSGVNYVEWPGSDVLAGVPTTTYTNVVFTPNNTAHPGLVLFKAAPVPDRNARMALSAYRWLELPAVLIGLPDASDRVGRMGTFTTLQTLGLA